MFNNNSTVAFIAGSLFGALIGTGLALLLAPQSGAKTRAQIKDTGVALKDQTTESLAEAGRLTQEQINDWQQKGQQAVRKGRRNVAKSVRQGKDSLVDTIENM